MRGELLTDVGTAEHQVGMSLLESNFTVAKRRGSAGARGVGTLL